MNKVRPLIGYKSLVVLNTYQTLLLGLKMLPTYGGKTYSEFYAEFEAKEQGAKESLLREAVAFVHLSEDEVDAVMSFAEDDNGVPYQKANIKNAGPEKIFNAIVSVMLEVMAIKIDILTETEKKNCLTGASISGEPI